MEKFWSLMTAVMVQGSNDYRRNDRLNAYLPRQRSAATVAVQERARDELRGFTQFVAGGGFAAIAALVGLARLLDPSDRTVLYQAAICFAVMGVSAIISLLFSIAEPVCRASLAHRLEEPDEPMTDQDDYYFSEAVNNRLWAAPQILRTVLVWRAVSALKNTTLFAATAAFCLGLALVVGPLK